MEATLQQFDALRSPGRTIRGHVDGLAGRMVAEMSSSEDAAVLQSCGYQFVNDQARARRGDGRTCSGKKIAKAMKRTIGPTCGPLGPGEAPSFAPTVSERRPLPDANRVIWLDNFGRLLGGKQWKSNRSAGSQSS